jgi:serine protease Do
MLRKLFAFTLISASACAAAYAQQTPQQPKAPGERRAPQIFFDSSFGGSFLGVETEEITKENFSRFGLNQVRGVAVERVLENSPAEKAGLQANDVIVRFNGEDVTGTRKLTRLISEVAPDHQARLTVLRGGSEREITVTIGKREFAKFSGSGFKFEDFPALKNMPEIPRVPAVPHVEAFPEFKEGEPGAFFYRAQASRQIGVGVSSLTKQLGEYFGVAEGKGLLINSVRANSPAEKAGLKAGDVIVEVDGKEISGNFDLIRALGEKKEGDVNLTIIRDRNRQTIRVTPEAAKDGSFNFEGNFPNIRLAPGTMHLNLPSPRVLEAPLPAIALPSHIL